MSLDHPVVTRQLLERAEDVQPETNTQLTREIHVLTTEPHRRVIDRH